MTGKVWLVGAGPGDPALFTIKGREVLGKADIVFYDSLVGQGILTMIPDTAELVNVGKRADRHTMPQEEINRHLYEAALKGKNVVRLKGGDPFLFGRGGEELELLAEHGIPFEIVPGITSPIAVPAYNGIPVTHRDFCSSLHIITGHKKAGAEYDIDFEALVRTKGTLVFLMGIRAMEDICNSLIKAGMDKEMPCAVLQKGTTARQKKVIATLSTLKQKSDEAGIETPAIIVVGKVCALSDEFGWIENLPLFGTKVLLTRPKELSSQTAEKLRRLGAEVLELPSISTVEIMDHPEWDSCIENIAKYQWLVFTSPTGVRIFFDKLKRQKKDVRVLGQIKIASIGTGTAKALSERGFFPDLIPEIYDGESLAKALAETCDGTEKILIPRAEQGNQILTSMLQEKGCEVDDLATYRTVYVSHPLIDQKTEIENGQIDCAVFTSASTVKGFVEATPGLDYSLVHAACIGKQTKAAADAYGMQTAMADKATIDSLVDLVVEMKGRK